MRTLGPGPIAMDTVGFIYGIEENERYLPLLMPLFTAVDKGSREIVTSAVTLLEVLVVPYRKGDAALAERYEAFLTRSRGIRVVEIDRQQLRAAARLRSEYPRLGTPDALQVAAARRHQCDTFLTNDRDFPDLHGLKVIQLDDHL